MNIHKVLLSSLLMASVCACVTLDGADTAQIDGRSVDYAFNGSDSPTVVFESGLGDGMGVWQSVVDTLPDHVATFAYSRPGYGGMGASAAYPSDRDGKRTGTEIAMHLRTLLQETGVEPPYIFVGHSIGGPYALTYALSYPDEVVGIILVDGRPPNFTQRCKDERAGMCEPPAVMTALMPQHQRAEIRGLSETYIPLRTDGSFARFSMTVLAATEPDAITSDKFQDLWIAEQSAFADAHKAKYVEALGSTHYIQKQQPELVVQEILEMHDNLSY